MNGKDFFELLRDTYAGKRVLITGHSGFKGAWLCSVLMEMGAVVAGYSDKQHGKDSLFSSLGLDSLVKNYWGDVRDLTKLKNCFVEFDPDFSFHLAAQAIVKKSYEDPVNTFSTNIIGTVNFFEAIRHANSLKSAVLVTSDKCYENKEWTWGYRENDSLGGKDPYSASKAAAELVFSSFQKSFFDEERRLGLGSARAGNVIGGGDWSEDRIVPDCVRSILKKQQITLRMPEATRPWQHVLEPLSGYLLLGAKLSREPLIFNGSWNFGPYNDDVRTVLDVAKYLTNYFGFDNSMIKIEMPDEAREARLLQLNCEKSHNILGWQPTWSVDEGINITADWYKRVLSGETPSTVTKSQIENYFGMKL